MATRAQWRSKKLHDCHQNDGVRKTADNFTGHSWLLPCPTEIKHWFSWYWIKLHRHVKMLLMKAYIKSDLYQKLYINSQNYKNNNIVTDLIDTMPGSSSVNMVHYGTIERLFSMGSTLWPFLCNGSVNKRQKCRDCFLCGPCCGYIMRFSRIGTSEWQSSEFSVGDSHEKFVDLWRLSTKKYRRSACEDFKCDLKILLMCNIWSDLKH
jgi:hypothetical protein